MLERINSDLRDMPVLDDAGADPPLVGVVYLPVHSGTVTERIGERHTGRFV